MRVEGSGKPVPATGDGVAREVRVWDPAVRLFHWSLVVLVSVNLYTGIVGGLREMDLHMLSGYAILALLLFRLAWGVVGSRHARFHSFVRGPVAVLTYLRALATARPVVTPGHNPLGALSVLALLACLLVQAITGLFAQDDILTQGPLAAEVSRSTSRFLTSVHHAAASVLYGLLVLHLAAVFGYLLVKKENLIRPMLTGRKQLADAATHDAPFASPWRALLLLALAAGIVAVVVR